MAKFKVGDRVRVYRAMRLYSGTVSKVDAYIWVVPDKTCALRMEIASHCRKLKPKKERRVIWVNYYVGGSSYVHATKETADQPGGSRLECVRFREWPEKSS